MDEKRVKFYMEMIKTLTAFIIGTGAGILALANQNKEGNQFLMFFVSIVCAVCVILLITLFTYLDENI